MKSFFIVYLSIRDHLANCHLGSTNQHVGRLPLVLGMPVVIVQNFNIPNGIVNGCTGILMSTQFTTDADSHRHAHSCIAKTSDATQELLSNLPEQHAVALEDTVDLAFTHPHSGKKSKFRRMQLPIMPGFTITAHKVQGLTIQSLIIDLKGYRGMESPYIMLSRARCLEDIAILHAFNFKRITCRPSAWLCAAV